MTRLRRDEVRRLASLGRLWGAVEFFSPKVALEPEFDWTGLVLTQLRSLIKDPSAHRFRRAVETLLDLTGGRLIGPQEEAEEDDDDDEDAGFASATRDTSGLPEPPPGVKVLAVAQLNEIGSDFAALDQASRDLFGQLAGAKKIVLDLRSAPYWYSRWLLPRALSQLLSRDMQAAGMAVRQHHGLANDQSTGGYRSILGFVQGRTIQAKPGPLARTPMAVVVDRSSGAWSLALGLRASGRARLVVDGAPATADAGALMLADGLRAAIPTSVWCEGQREGPEPDAVVRSKRRGDAVKRAIALLDASSSARQARRRPSADGGARVRRPIPGAADSFPSPELRLLALYQLWNAVRWFYPYHELIDEPWDGVLEPAIQPVLEARDAAGYWRALAATAARIQDSHGGVYGPGQDSALGGHWPGVYVRPIEGQMLVAGVDDDIGGLEVGDVIRSVDGVSVAGLIGRLTPYLAASTEQALLSKCAVNLLRGQQGTTAKLQIRRAGRIRTISVSRDRPYAGRARTTEVFSLLTPNVGYIDLDRLLVRDVERAMATVKGTAALIFDMRGYPNGTAWKIAPYLASRDAAAAGFRRCDPYTFDPAFQSLTRFDQPLPSPGPRSKRYRGEHIVVLIDERAVSQSEHTCLFIKAARPDTVFIGTPTNGANGDVTYIDLPGNLRFPFSGQGVWWPNGDQLQRRGVQPDIEVRPTVAGIRDGRDEVLETAMDYLRERLKRDAPALS